MKNHQIKRIEERMKTIVKDRKRPRYKIVKDTYEKCRDQLIEMSGITLDEYFETEFQCGLNLIESYYQGLDHNRVSHYKEQLLTDERLEFWKWLRINRQQQEFIWLNHYSFRHEVESGVYDQKNAQHRMVQRWKEMQLSWVNSQDTHRRFFYWLRTNENIVL